MSCFEHEHSWRYLRASKDMACRLRYTDGGKKSSSGTRIIVALVIVMLCVDTAMLLSDHRKLTSNRWVSKAVHRLEEAYSGSRAEDVTYNASHEGQSIGSSSKRSLWESSKPTDTASDRLLGIFQQVQKCNRSPIMKEYVNLHNQISKGQEPARYLISIAPEANTADRLTGVVTQFYFALLGRRAFTAYESPSSSVPSFAAACDFPLFNWTHSQPLPAAVVEPLLSSRTLAEQALGKRYPAPYSKYSMLHWIDVSPHQVHQVVTTNMSAFPAKHPDIPYVVSASTRGATWKLANSPYHKDDFWNMALRPDEVFMCGFWALCQPNTAVQQLFLDQYWQPLAEPNMLKIGIEVNFGHQREPTGDSTVDAAHLLSLAAPYFDCASSIEKVFSVPGQKVVWYLLSDTRAFRTAAQQRYGTKLLTDDDLEDVHSSCEHSASTAGCTAVALQRSVGSMLAFSLADFHIISDTSSLGRLGAWMSGKWNNIHEVGFDDQHVCDPYEPLPPMMAALHGPGV